jgi:2-polyprenyl-6-methoxyphenol hydroxylase-like FAD-dependent oxidoreductase
MEPVELGAPMDVLWLRVSRHAGEPSGLVGFIGTGEMAAMIDRRDYWQIAFLIPKGSYRQLREQGLPRLRQRLSGLLPFITDRVEEIDDWDKVAFLEVGVNRLRRWDRPGLVAIGDAAHTMSPIGGVGINLAVQDAVATANLMADRLLEAQADPRRFDRTLNPKLVQRIQRRRQLPTVGIQLVQRFAQRQIIDRVLGGNGEPRLPWPLSTDRGRRLMSQAMMRVMMYGLRPEHVHTPERERVDETTAGRQPTAS